MRCLSPPLVLVIYAVLLALGLIERTDLSVVVFLLCEAVAGVLYIRGTREKLRRMRDDIASR